MVWSYVKLGIAALLPAIASFLLYWMERKTKMKGMNAKVKQGIYGLLFGALAIVGTEAGIPFNGAQANCRDAAVLCAGLLFGAPAGIIAGLIGGIERWIAVAWGVGTFTRVACTVSTILAGFYAAALRKYLFEGKKPGWIISFAIGVVMEVFHLTMVFITNMDDPQKAMEVVRACTVPMVVSNGLSVMIAAVSMELFLRKREPAKHENMRISQTIQRWLLVTVLFAFALTSFFVVRLQSTLAIVQTNQSLQEVNNELVHDITDAADENMLEQARKAARHLNTMGLGSIAAQYGLTEINLADENGVVIDSTRQDFIGFEFDSGAQTAEFLCLLNGADEYVQEFGTTMYNPALQRKYAGVRLESGFLQVGYDAPAFQREIAQRVKGASRNRRVGNTGYVVIFDAKNNVVSAPSTFDPAQTEDLLNVPIAENEESALLEIGGVKCYCRRDMTEGYSIIAVLPSDEAMQISTIAIYVNTFLEILVFALLFGLIYLLIRQVVVKQIKSINVSLAKITGGDLNEVVNVRSNAEFSSLSDDINSTVSTLKRYIAEAAARIDAELVAAKSIQSSALPVVNKNISGRNDLDIHAFMATAKEVGGDFYDFYMTRQNTFNFMVADVSGKGIPASLFMMRAKTELKNMMESGEDLADAFTHGNADLCQGNDAEMFVTAWQGSLNLDTGLVNYVNAGHNHPLVRHGNGQFEMLKSRVNFVLGGMDGMRYKEQELKLEPGDTLFLYTDGVTEATNASNELYGDDRLLAVANKCEYESMAEFCKAVKEDIDRFVGEAPQFDDITMLAVRFIGRKPDWERRFEEATLDDIPELTAGAEEELERIGCSMRVITQMSVAIDEIYSNIVKYAYPHVKGSVRVSIHEEEKPHSVSMTFEDSGIPYNPMTNAEPDITLSAEERRIGGLGIFIVKKTMDDVQYHYENDRNIFTIRKKL